MAWWVWACWGGGFAVPLLVAALMWRKALTRRRRDDPVENHRRADNGLAAVSDPRRNWFRNTVTSPWLWVIMAFGVFAAFALWYLYMIVYSNLVISIASDLKQANLPVQILSRDAFNEALWPCIGFASLTLGAYLLIFLLFDRWRPSPPSMKLVALVWGGSAATFFAMIANSWVGSLITNAPGGDAAAAVFIAPFVEEACKATVLFLLVMAMRRRVCSVLQMIGLSGLAAAGFAFTENVTYYVRLFCEASLVPGVDANAYLHQMVVLRGIQTSFGHPLFTMMTAFGLIIGLRQRSKLARIICPLTGYLVAALLHMCFNGLATFLDDPGVLVRYGLVVVIMVVFWLVGQFLAQRTTIAWRLDDYVRMGWLRDRDPVVYSAPTKRLKLTVAGWLRGWRIGKATMRLMSDITELAYLRYGVVNGTVDAGVTGREHDLVVDAAALRGIALDEPVGLKVVPRYHGPAAWHRFKAWRNARWDAQQPATSTAWGAPVAPSGQSTPAWGAPVAPSGQSTPAWGAPVPSREGAW